MVECKSNGSIFPLHVHDIGDCSLHMTSDLLIVLIEFRIKAFNIVYQCSKLCSLLLRDADNKRNLLTTLSHVGEVSVGDVLVQKIQAVILSISGRSGAQIQYVLSCRQIYPLSLKAWYYAPIIPCSGVSTMCLSLNFSNSSSDNLSPLSDEMEESLDPYFSNPIQAACFLHFFPV